MYGSQVRSKLLLVFDCLQYIHFKDGGELDSCTQSWQYCLSNKLKMSFTLIHQLQPFKQSVRLHVNLYLSQSAQVLCHSYTIRLWAYWCEGEGPRCPRDAAGAAVVLVRLEEGWMWAFGEEVWHPACVCVCGTMVFFHNLR